MKTLVIVLLGLGMTVQGALEDAKPTLPLRAPKATISALLREKFRIGMPYTHVIAMLKKDVRPANINESRKSKLRNRITKEWEYVERRLHIELGSYGDPRNPPNTPLETVVGAEFDFDERDLLKAISVTKHITGT